MQTLYTSSRSYTDVGIQLVVAIQKLIGMGLGLGGAKLVSRENSN